MRRTWWVRPGCVFAISGTILLAGCGPKPPPITPLDIDAPPNTDPLPPEVLSRFWKVKGARLQTADGTPVVLRGIAFGNWVWDDVELPSSHHSEVDFERVKKMGMNSIRFYMNAITFEDADRPGEYKEQGFAWLDQNVEWAREHGLRLVLNMHVPPGGYQSGGEGDELWESEEAQLRFVVLWRTIAERYRAEPAIAGYDLLNEPVVTKSIDQWKELAERTIAEIREVDQHHAIFVERVNAVGGDWAENEDRNFFRVDDPNVVYEFHFYKPYHFTHQNAAWSDFAAREGKYPDPTMPEVDWFHLKTVETVDSDKLPPGDSGWTLLETEVYRAPEKGVDVGKPILVCDDSGGRAFFDTLSLTKFESRPVADPQGEGEAESELPPAETVFEVNLDTRRGWYFYNPSGKGEAKFVTQGQGDASALSIINTEGPANLGSDPLRFFVEPGKEYQLSGVARGIGLGEKSSCLLRLEFSSSIVPVQGRGKDYLSQELDAYLAWGQKEKVPLYLGEFGTIRDSFLPGRGGETWVQDMLDLIIERKLGFAYHDYHEIAFGLFVGDSGLPNVYSANQLLYDVFVKTLVGPDADTTLTPAEPVPGAPELEAEAPQKPSAPSGSSKPEEEQTYDNYDDFE